MVIKASSARNVDALLRDLLSDRAVTREGAVARLTVIGVRAVDRLTALAAAAETASPARAAAFRALEAIGDPRALDVALRALADPDAGVATAAIGVARAFLMGPGGLPALDALTAVAVDRARPDAIREAALRALGDLDAGTLSPLMEALLTDPSARLRAAAQGASGQAVAEPAAAADRWLERADDIALPDDPEAVRRELGRRGGVMNLPLLHRLIERLREREQATSGQRRREWMAARAAAHAALAARGSRLAVYDLRESLDAATEPLPVEFLAALTMIGDASCLEPIAGAFARAREQKGASPAGSDWWHRHLADAFQAIVSREAITRRNVVAKKIEKRWPDASRALWPGRSTAPADTRDQ